MSASQGKFALLLDLAKETSSEKRRDLLRQVTDVFVQDDDARTEKEAEIFDEIFSAVSADMEVTVRAELAKKIAKSNAPLNRTARRLALSEIEVARPVIEKSRALTEHDILDVIDRKGQDHMMAVTKRDDIGERVSSALVDKGQDNVVASLLENRTARIDRETFEKVAKRADTSTMLHAPFVKNQNAPLDLLNEVYLKVEQKLRREIMRKFHGVSPGDLADALAASKTRLSEAYGALPEDYVASCEYVDGLEKWKPLEPVNLTVMLRENRVTAFCIGFAKLTEVDVNMILRLVETCDLDALAMLAKGAGFDKALFVTICLLIAKDSSNMNRAESLGHLYTEVSQAAAQRALRFWKVRQTSQRAA